ncbi:MAG: cation-transporting P-type ATPase [Clostridia bacterium]|nr:cation-transporting P-type ATPase [Clostridia bacterium]
MKNRNDWHLLEKEKVLGLLGSDLYKGLSGERVRRNRRKWGANSVWRVKHASAGEIAAAAVFDLATLLLLVSAAAAAMFERGAEAGLIAGILLVGGILRTITFVRANRILEDMAKEKIPVASVIREGRVCLVPAGEIAAGDIVYLEEGDTVPCDGRVVTGEDSLVDERGITENKEPVHKFDTVIATESAGGEVPCEYRSNCVFAGSRVLSGSLRIAATAVGGHTLIAMKQGGIEIEPVGQLPMVESLSKRSRNTSLVMLACVLIITALSMTVGDGPELIDVFLSTMAMAAAAMSEFLTMIGTIIIAVTVRDCASGAERRSAGTSSRSGRPKDHIAGAAEKPRSVIREPSELEHMAGITKIVFCGSSYFKSGRMELCAYRAGGVFAELDEKKTGYCVKNGGGTPSAGRLLNLAMAAAAADNRSLAGADAKSQEASETAGYLLRGADAYARKTGQPVEFGCSMLDHMDACSKTAGLHISLIVENGEVICAACGKIDAVLRACTMAETPDGPVPITDEMRREIYTQCAGLEFAGARVTAVAHRISPFQQLNRVTVLTEYMTFAGFLAVSQEWEKNAAENVEFLYRDGICPVLFTEEPEADLYYCHRLGLFDKRTKIIAAAEVTDDTFRDAPRGVIVSFSGLEHPAQAYAGVMQILMGSERKNGGCVAAVGRKIRDASVIAMADVGCAVADSPVRAVSGVLSGRSVMVVYPEKTGTEARFGGMDGVIRAVYASRQAMENVESAKLYLTAAQSARLLLMLVSVFLPVAMLSPVHILAWGLLFDFAAVLVMAFEYGKGERIRPRLARKHQPDEDDDTEERKPALRGILPPVLIGILWGVLTAGAAILYGWLAKIAGTDSDGLLFLCCSLILAGLITSCGIMKKGSLFRPGRINTAYVSFALASALLIPLLLLTAHLSWQGSLLCLGAALIPAGILLAFFEFVKCHRVKNVNNTQR